MANKMADNDDTVIMSGRMHWQF